MNWVHKILTLMRVLQNWIFYELQMMIKGNSIIDSHFPLTFTNNYNIRIYLIRLNLTLIATRIWTRVHLISNQRCLPEIFYQQRTINQEMSFIKALIINFMTSVIWMSMSKAVTNLENGCAMKPLTNTEGTQCLKPTQNLKTIIYQI